MGLWPITRKRGRHRAVRAADRLPAHGKGGYPWGRTRTPFSEGTLCATVRSGDVHALSVRGVCVRTMAGVWPASLFWPAWRPAFPPAPHLGGSQRRAWLPARTRAPPNASGRPCRAEGTNALKGHISTRHLKKTLELQRIFYFTIHVCTVNNLYEFLQY